jgi:hypothetical protein
MLGSEEVIVGNTNITKELWGEFADMYRSELAIAEEEQKKLMQAERRVTGGVRKNLSFGRLRMKVCPEVFYFWEGKLGEGVWRDKTFLNWIEKRFGELIKVKSVSSKMGV